MGRIVFRNRLDPDNVSADITIAWATVSPTSEGDEAPGWTSYMKPVYDAVSGQTLWYNGRIDSSNIWSSHLFAYDASAQHWTRLGGEDVALGVCGDGSTATIIGGGGISPWPSTRHPIQQLAIDTTRGAMHMFNGVCANNVPYDHWAYTLNADPTDNTWELVLEDIGNVPNIEVSGAMVYDPVTDLFIAHGTNSGNFPKTWVFAPGVGAASAAQIAAGATTRGDWYLVYSPGTIDPPQSYFTTLVYSDVNGKVYHFGHSAGVNEVWEYDVAEQTWTDKDPTWIGGAEDVNDDAPEYSNDYLSAGKGEGLIYYRQTSHQPDVTSDYGDYTYNPLSNEWAAISSTGTGPQRTTYLVFDPSLGTHGTLVAWDRLNTQLWHGTIQ
jgi:hypothetical protein